MSSELAEPNRNPNVAVISSVFLALGGLISRIAHPGFEGAVIHVRTAVAFGLVAVVAAAYVSRKESSVDIADGIAVAGIAVIVAVPAFTLWEVISGVVLWDLPVTRRLSVGVVLGIVTLSTVLLTVVPITAMFALGTANSRRERVGIAGLLLLAGSLSVAPLMARSAFEIADATNALIAIATALVIGTPLFVFARLAESGER